MKSIVRTIASVVAGVVTALLLLIAVEGFSAVVHPFPEGFGHTTEEMCLHVARYPAWVLAAVVPMWGAAAFLSVYASGKFGNLVSVAIVGGLFLAAVVANVLMLPYPQWFSIASPLVVAVGIAAAVWMKCRPGPAGRSAGGVEGDVLQTSP